MKHPASFLEPGQKITPQVWKDLMENHTTITLGQAEGEVIFTFSAESIMDSQDMVITANPGTGNVSCHPKPHCACKNEPLSCQCKLDSCYVCGANLVATSSTCDSQFCVDDQCPLCNHQREDCLYQQVLDHIKQEADRAREDDPSLSIALAHVAGVSEVLAPGVGDAPIFPATVRVLDHLLGGSHDPDDQGKNIAKASWTCTDGSTAFADPNHPGWLTWKKG